MGHKLKTGGPRRFQLYGKRKCVGGLLPSELEESLPMKDVHLVEALCEIMHIQLQDESVTQISTKVRKLDQRDKVIRQVKALHNGQIRFCIQLTKGKFGVHLTKAATLVSYAIRRGVVKDDAAELQEAIGRLTSDPAGLSYEPAD